MINTLRFKKIGKFNFIDLKNIKRNSLFKYRADIKTNNFYLKVGINPIKKKIYIHSLECGKEPINKTLGEFKKLIFNIIDFAKENKFKEVSTNTWIFAKYPNIGSYFGFIPENKEKLKKFNEFLSKKGIHNIVKEKVEPFLEDNQLPSVFSDEASSQILYKYKLKYYSKNSDILEEITVPNKFEFPKFILRL